MTLQTKDSLLKEIIFIDPTVEDYESLLAGIYPDTKVVILDRMKDGISQITENLQGGTYKAVHIVSHGSEGSLQLGSKQLNSSNLDSYKSQLQQWAKYLTDEADILLYGCDVAAGKTGVGFVQQLSQLTGADVAASNDLTGNAALGGDWDLEVKTGKIEAPLVFQNHHLQAYNYTLSNPPVIINEWSQGASSNREWVELLVTATTDLRGWTLADTQGTYTTFKADSSLWQSVQAGTLIVIYNGNVGERDAILPADDVLLSDNNFRIVVAHNNSTLFTPGTWDGFGNPTATDNPILGNSSGVVHDWDQSNNSAFTVSPPRPGINQAVYYTSNTAAGVSTATNYTRTAASGTTSAVTPGSSNGGTNTTWIDSLRGFTAPITISNPLSPMGAGQLFGASLASNGSEILIGAPGTTSLTNYKGLAYRYNVNGGLLKTFNNPSSVTAEQFGFAVATDGTNYLVGASKWDGSVADVGIAYQFNASGVNQHTFNNSVNNDDSEFGSAIAILNNGNYVISAPEKGKSLATDNAGEVRLFKNDGTLLTTIVNPETQTYVQDARFGFSLAGADNNILIGSPGFGTDSASYGTGRAYWYNTNGSLLQTFNNPDVTKNDLFGLSVASNSAGTRVLIGSPGDDMGGTDAGVVYLYDTTTSTLLKTFTNPDLGNLGFGASVKFVGNDILIGAAGKFNVDASNIYTPVAARGAVYLYDGDASSPTYNLERIFTNPGTSNDAFGTAITAVDRYKIAISAPFSNSGAGSVYLYDINNLPLVSFTATSTNLNLTESISNSVTYRISRDGITTNALTVKLVLDANSTANSSDYTLKDSNNNIIVFSNGIATVTLAAATSSIDLTLTPVDDTITEVNETIKLNLVADTAYASSAMQSNATITILANDNPPVVEPDKIITLNEDASNTPLNITAPTDVDGDSLTITVTGLSDASKGKVYLADGTTQVNNNQILTAAELTGLVFRPVADANGSAGSFSYSVNDGKVSSSQSITFAVNPVNDAPVVQANTTITLNEDASNTPLNITAPTDVDGDTLTITVTGLSDASKGKVYLAGGTTQVNNNQILTAAELTGLVFRPVADANDSAGSFSYSVNDGKVSSSQSITFTVNSVNDRPTFNIGANQSVKTGAGQQTIAGWASGFNSGAANESGQKVAEYIVEVISNSGVVQDIPTINIAGNLIYTPSAIGTAEFRVKVRDDGGTANGGFDTSISTTQTLQTFKINVNSTTTNSIYGTPNADNLKGTDQSDRISGLDNDDIIYGGLGSDRIFGDNGNDTLYGDLGIIFNSDPKLISDIQPVYGANFNRDDTIAGGAGNDKIYGNLGNDKLYGDEGDDQIWGGEGNDEIWGSYGNDTLYGGAGKDAFVLVRGQGADTIMDFTTEDVLGCAGALRYSSLIFTKKNGDTLITDKTTSGELLATLKGFLGTASDGGLF